MRRSPTKVEAIQHHRTRGQKRYEVSSLHQQRQVADLRTPHARIPLLCTLQRWIPDAQRPITRERIVKRPQVKLCTPIWEALDHVHKSPIPQDI